MSEYACLQTSQTATLLSIRPGRLTYGGAITFRTLITHFPTLNYYIEVA